MECRHGRLWCLYNIQWRKKASSCALEVLVQRATNYCLMECLRLETYKTLLWHIVSHRRATDMLQRVTFIALSDIHCAVWMIYVWYVKRKSWKGAHNKCRLHQQCIFHTGCVLGRCSIIVDTLNPKVLFF